MRKLMLFAGSVLASLVAATASAQTVNWAGPYVGVVTGASESKPYGYYHGYYYNIGDGAATGGTTGAATGGGTTTTTTGGAAGSGGYTPPGTTATPPTPGATPAGYISYNIDKHFTDFNFAGVGGYNLQNDNWVYGIEADYGFIGGSGGGTNIDPGGSGRYDTVRIDSGGHVRARAGYALMGWLPYVAAGGVIDDVHAAHWGVSPTSNGVAQLFQDSSMRVGWTVAVGVDTDLGQGWSLRAEYARDYLGKHTDQWVQDQLYSYTAFDIDVFHFGILKRF